MLIILNKNKGLSWQLNPGPLAPKARIIPLDHWATNENVIFKNKCVYQEAAKQMLNLHFFKKMKVLLILFLSQSNVIINISA